MSEPRENERDLCAHLKLKEELVKYGGLSKSGRFRQLLTSFMLGNVTLVLCRSPLRRDPSLVPLHRVTRRLYSSRLKKKKIISVSFCSLVQ